MVYSALSDDASTVSQFTRRKKVTITTGGTSTPTDYQVKLTITYEPGMQADFDDIRFNTKANGYIDYWIESYTASTTATVWVELPDTITDPGLDTIWMYYGNSGLNDGGNGIDAFEFFDDFNISWIKDAGNPVIAHSTGEDDEDNYQLYRSEIIDDGTDYRMYYCANQEVFHKDQIFTATSVKSNNFKNWTKHTVSGDVTPVLAFGSSGQWDEDNCYLESIIKESSSSYKMWYIGDDGSVAPHFLRVGYATSTDGVNWTKSGSNPIYTNTTVSANGVNFFAVWKENDSQYYAALGHYQVDRVDILTSTDGLSWSTLTSNVITDIQPSSLKKIDGVYYIYGASKNGYASTKCYSATSISGSWTDRGVQITAIGSGWEQRCYHPSLFEISTGEYLLSYSGWDGSIKPEVGIATLSSNVPYSKFDSSKWTKHASANVALFDGTMETWADGGYYITSVNSFDISDILEIKTSRTDNGSDIAWGYGRTWIDSTDQVKFRYYTSKIARLKNGATWHNAALAWSDAPEITGIRVSSGTAYFYEDRSLLDSFTHAAVPSGNLPIAFDTTGNYHFGADWVLIRKYIANEPTPSYGITEHQRRTPKFIG